VCNSFNLKNIIKMETIDWLIDWLIDWIDWLTDWLTDDDVIEQNRSSEIDSRSDGQEIPSIIWNPKFHYRAHKSLSLDRFLSQLYPLNLISCFLKINFNINFLPTRKLYAHFPASPSVLRVSPTFPPRFDCPNTIR